MRFLPAGRFDALDVIFACNGAREKAIDRCVFCLRSPVGYTTIMYVYHGLDELSLCSLPANFNIY
jgi:hypothetical protein